MKVHGNTIAVFVRGRWSNLLGASYLAVAIAFFNFELPTVVLAMRHSRAALGVRWNRRIFMEVAVGLLCQASKSSRAAIDRAFRR
jgi:hypothetical protein